MFSDAEISLIKNTFAGENEENLYLIRNVLLQFPLSKEERVRLKAIMTDEVYKVVKKRIFPEIDPEVPLFNLSDMYQTLSQDLQKHGVEEMAPLFDAKMLEIDYLRQQFEILKDPETVLIDGIFLDRLAELKNKPYVQKYVDTTARNYILAHVDTMINHLKVLAGQKDESVDDIKKRLTRDSSK